MKVGEIWRWKAKAIERIRQQFINTYGDDSNFNEDLDLRVFIKGLNEKYVEHESLDHRSSSVDSIEYFLEDYEKVYNE